MQTKIFVNLAVKDLERSKDFYKKLGFLIDPQFTNQKGACIVISDTIYLMLLVEEFFKTFTSKEIADTTKTVESLFAISQDSKERVDQIVDNAMQAGGSGVEEQAGKRRAYNEGEGV